MLCTRGRSRWTSTMVKQPKHHSLVHTDASPTEPSESNYDADTSANGKQHKEQTFRSTRQSGAQGHDHDGQNRWAPQWTKSHDTDGSRSFILFWGQSLAHLFGGIQSPQQELILVHLHIWYQPHHNRNGKQWIIHRHPAWFHQNEDCLWPNIWSPWSPGHPHWCDICTETSSKLTVSRKNDKFKSDVAFSKDQSFLTLNGKILAYGIKTNNLFTYMTLPPLPNQSELADYTAEPTEIVLWHHRLTHTGYSTLENMKRLKTAISFHPNLYHGSIPQCTNCPFGKQTWAPFQNVEDLPTKTGNTIVSDLCSPFDLSVVGYRYFIMWIDLKMRYASIDFLKNKNAQLSQNHSKSISLGFKGRRRQK